MFDKEFNELLKYYINVYSINQSLEVYFIEAYRELLKVKNCNLNPKDRYFIQKAKKIKIDVLHTNIIFNNLKKNTNLTYSEIYPFWETLVSVLEVDILNPKSL